MHAHVPGEAASGEASPGVCDLVRNSSSATTATTTVITPRIGVVLPGRETVSGGRLVSMVIAHRLLHAVRMGPGPIDHMFCA